jgi:hypothetical protein
LKQFTETAAKKHLSDVNRNSSAYKTLAEYVFAGVPATNRPALILACGKNSPPSSLMFATRRTTGNVARALRILTRTQNDWKAVR